MALISVSVANGKQLLTLSKLFGWKLRIEKLNDFHLQAIKALSEKRDVFVETKKGSGKTIIYEGWA